MNCREFVDFLMSYLDEELDAEARRVFESHLNGCPGCLGYMEDYKKTVKLGRCACKDEAGPVPKDAPRELVNAILEARKTLT
jgi:anti-sigma factor RsiW